MAFDYTSGNPNNLTGASPAAMTDIQGPFVDLKTFLNARIAAIPTLVTSLPVGPVDGQEVYFLADSTNGIVWHLRYRSASASTYKWEVVGGPPLVNVLDTGFATSSTTYVDGGGPAVTIPALAGDYDVEIHTGQVPPSVLNGVVYMSFSVGATAAIDADAVVTQTPVAGSMLAFGSTVRRKTAVAASSQIAAKFKATGGSGTNQSRVMRVRPVRVG